MTVGDGGKSEVRKKTESLIMSMTTTATQKVTTDINKYYTNHSWGINTFSRQFD